MVSRWSNDSKTVLSARTRIIHTQLQKASWSAWSCPTLSDQIMLFIPMLKNTHLKRRTRKSLCQKRCHLTLDQDLEQFLIQRFTHTHTLRETDAYIRSVKGSFVEAGTSGTPSKCFWGSLCYVGTLDRCWG